MCEKCNVQHDVCSDALQRRAAAAAAATVVVVETVDCSCARHRHKSLRHIGQQRSLWEDISPWLPGEKTFLGDCPPKYSSPKWPVVCPDRHVKLLHSLTRWLWEDISPWLPGQKTFPGDCPPKDSSPKLPVLCPERDVNLCIHSLAHYEKTSRRDCPERRHFVEIARGKTRLGNDP